MTELTVEGRVGGDLTSASSPLASSRLVQHRLRQATEEPSDRRVGVHRDDMAQGHSLGRPRGELYELVAEG